MIVLKHERMTDGSYEKQEYESANIYLKGDKLFQNIIGFHKTISTIELNTEKNDNSCGVYFEVKKIN